LRRVQFLPSDHENLSEKNRNRDNPQTSGDTRRNRTANGRRVSWYSLKKRTLSWNVTERPGGGSTDGEGGSRNKKDLAKKWPPIYRQPVYPLGPFTTLGRNCAGGGPAVKTSTCKGKRTTSQEGLTVFLPTEGGHHFSLGTLAAIEREVGKKIGGKGGGFR